ncbi:hypothetical protein SCARR_02063 [Pontiella sulfatireligans]|uniref:Glycosyltransferase RgtA/B/C/D-like domain-containing protein n=2 Tax=Pontiella sulfatireligans TaxID=2750658 RepID=A0A6C2UJF0_9BACT|nr:hypothetical protein SCARR_02063 [Pontiella sulfatireligans]
MPIVFMLTLAMALWLRLPGLEQRPMHHDEANQAYRCGILLESGEYTYDADDHHGPTLYYLTLPSAWLAGVQTFVDSNEWTYRLVPAFFGFLLVLCTPLLRSGIGCVAVLAVALFSAISPAMAYYSRFYIQEMLLVFFTYLAIASGWLSWRSGSRRWAAACGLALGLMFATKETAIMAYAALFGAAILCAVIDRKVHLPLKNMLLAAACAIFVSIVLFSSFFTNVDGPLESIMAYQGYFARGTGVNTDHVHPWYFYLRMLSFYRFDGGPVWSEALILVLGLGGCASIVLKKIPANCDLGLARFIMFYTLLLTAVYSVIPYKTPWCMLSFLHGWIILAGIGVGALVQKGRWSWLWVVPILLASAQLAGQAERTTRRYAADYRNPYVYAHTAPDFMNLVRRIGDLEAVSPKGNELYIQVAADPKAMWPLPFYLRGFKNVGYWDAADPLPVHPPADIIISSPALEVDPDAYLSEYYGLRADTLMAIHIRTSLWDAFMQTRQ